LLLEEYWRANSLLKNVPIVYATPLANKSLKIMETYVNMCSDHVIEQSNNHINTFRSMQFVTNVSEPAGVDWETKVMNPNTACVVLCAPGMFQSGTSRELFELWCGDRRNGVVFTAYSVAGTLAHDLQNSAELVLLPDGRKLAVRCSLKWVSFSAHSDYRQTSEFVQRLNVNHVVLVHGEANLMRRLAAKLKEEFNCGVYTPQNTVEVFLNLKDFNYRSPLAADSSTANAHQHVCALVGQAAPKEDKEQEEAAKTTTATVTATAGDGGESEMEAEDEAERERVRRVQAKLDVEKFQEGAMETKQKIPDEFNFFVVKPQGQKIIVTPDELEIFTDIRKHKIKFATSVNLAGNFVIGNFKKEIGRLFEISSASEKVINVANCVELEFSDLTVKVSWQAGPVADLVSDTVLRV
jgi:cleavage and polyadenylation specificity factor subunit 3